jgi:hypothetical protein
MSNGTRGRSQETPTGGNPGGSSADPLGGAESIENGTAGTNGGTELPPVTSDNSGSSTGGVGNDETTGQRKRGRPAGSTNKAGGGNATAKLSRTELRGKLTGAISGLVSFGFSAVASSRAEKLKPVSLPLANAVFQTWLVGEEQAKLVAEPAANTLVEYLPDRWLQSVAQTVDPLACVSCLYVLIATRLAQEKGIVDSFVQAQTAARQAAEMAPNNEPPTADTSGIPDPVESAAHPTDPGSVNA